jgi:phospholipid transport system substrate-binding protein
MHASSCRRRVLAIVAAALLTSALPAFAQTASAVTQPIQQLDHGLLEIMKDGHATPFEKRFDILAPIVDRTFNLKAILRESVGPSWPDLPADQQDMLTQAFRRYTVASYVNSFDHYHGQHFVIAPTTRSITAGEQVVNTKIVPRSGSPTALDYVMRNGPDGWQVVDVLAEGSISRVAVQRSDFRRLLTRGGPQALAESLRTKSASLAGATG